MSDTAMLIAILSGFATLLAVSVGFERSAERRAEKRRAEAERRAEKRQAEAEQRAIERHAAERKARKRLEKKVDALGTELSDVKADVSDIKFEMVRRAAHQAGYEAGRRDERQRQATPPVPPASAAPAEIDTPAEAEQPPEAGRTPEVERPTASASAPAAESATAPKPVTDATAAMPRRAAEATRAPLAAQRQSQPVTAQQTDSTRERGTSTS